MNIRWCGGILEMLRAALSGGPRDQASSVDLSRVRIQKDLPSLTSAGIRRTRREAFLLHYGIIVVPGTIFFQAYTKRCGSEASQGQQCRAGKRISDRISSPVQHEIQGKARCKSRWTPPCAVHTGVRQVLAYAAERFHQRG